MILIAESGCGVVKLHDHLGNAGLVYWRGNGVDLSIVCHLGEFFTIQVNVLALGVFISTLRTVLVVL